jgi:hypothetical protein
LITILLSLPGLKVTGRSWNFSRETRVKWGFRGTFTPIQMTHTASPADRKLLSSSPVKKIALLLLGAAVLRAQPDRYNSKTFRRS